MNRVTANTSHVVGCIKKRDGVHIYGVPPTNPNREHQHPSHYQKKEEKKKKIV
jgi:hypothetical protein